MNSPDQEAAGAGLGRPPPSVGEANNLARRIASALVLAPLALLAAYAGGWCFVAVCALAAGAILWEWSVLVAGRTDNRIVAPGWAALLAAAVLAGLGFPGAAAAVAVLGAALAGAVSAQGHAVWAAGGVIYAAIALLAPALLRSDPVLGFRALLFLFATVWVTDVFAYFTGRAVGGPLLWPKLSPKKTWAGAIGGLFGGVAGGILVAYASGFGKPVALSLVAAALSVLAQGGDLFESAVKRRFGAKDASRLIPGHGGVMDRLDGFLVAALAALVIGLLRQGSAAPARGLLLW